MGQLQFLEKKGAFNYVTNPSVELATTGYTAVGSAISRTFARARFGHHSLRVDTNGAAQHEGAYFSVNPGTSGQRYGASVYARGVGIVRARIRDATNGLEWSSDPKVLDDRRWVRLEVVGRTGTAACADLRLHVETDREAQATTFWADAFQVEDGEVSTYFDGDQEAEHYPHGGNCYMVWAGPAHASISVRRGRFRQGGVPITVDSDKIGVYVTDASGLGMAPVRWNLQQLGTQDKTLLQDFHGLPRTIQLTFWARKDPKTGICSPVSLKELHLLRENLERLLKPDASSQVQPMVMRYVDGDDVIQIPVVYDGGMEWDGDLRYAWMNSFAVRLISTEAYWEADTQEVQEIDPEDVMANVGCIMAKINGVWNQFGTGAAGVVYCIEVAPNGDVYVGGDFVAIDGVIRNRIARYDGAAWNDLGAGVDDGAVYAIAFGPNGVVYVGGSFTAVDGGTGASHIALFDTATATWSDMGDAGGANEGLDDDVLALATDENGLLYAGGEFHATNEAAPTTVYHVTYYDPATDLFYAMGLGPGLDDVVYCARRDAVGDWVHFGGAFRAETGGVAGTLDRVATWAATAWQAMAQGLGATVYALAVAQDGRVYAGGAFTGLINVWNRQRWYACGQAGEGFTGGTACKALAISPKGLVVGGGDFTGATNCPSVNMAGSWNGSRFSHLDFWLPAGGGQMINALAFRGDDSWVGFTVVDNVDIPSRTSVLYDGLAATQPVLYVLGPAHVLWFENQTTGELIRLDLTVQAGERVLVDLREAKQKAISDYRGNVSDGILPDSDVGSFRLLPIPGRNDVCFMALNTTNDTEVAIRMPVLHWSFDDIVWAVSDTT